jgi:hypothetical protein
MTQNQFTYSQIPGSPFHVIVAMLAADGGSLLRPGYIDRALEVEEYLQYKLKGKLPDKTL